MKIRTIVFLSILLLVLFIAGINWDAFTTPVEISLLFTKINLPIGLSMLAVLGIMGIVFLAFIGRTQTMALLEHRTLSKELKKAQKLASEEEESRFRELKTSFDEEVEFLHRKLDLIMENMDIGAPDDQFVPHGEASVEQELKPKQLDA